MIKFVIFADARTGGTHVMSKLNSHPQIHAVSEPFAHKNIIRHDEQIEWMRSYFENEMHFSAKGYRTKIEHQDNIENFVQCINQMGIKCFILQRRNIVKKAISRINAITLFKRTNDYNLKNKLLHQDQYEIKPRRLLIEIETCEKQKKEMDDLAKVISDVKVLHYEDILIDEIKFFNGIIVDSLELEEHELKTSVYKNTSDDLRKSIVNFDQLDNRLKDSVYSKDLNEVLVS